MDQNNMRLLGAYLQVLLIRKLCFLSFLFLSVNSAALDDGTWTYELMEMTLELLAALVHALADIIPNTIAGNSSNQYW